jgi:hypothetical protein
VAWWSKKQSGPARTPSTANQKAAQELELRKGWQRGIKIAGETAVSTTKRTSQLGSQLMQKNHVNEH